MGYKKDIPYNMEFQLIYEKNIMLKNLFICFALSMSVFSGAVLSEPVSPQTFMVEEIVSYGQSQSPVSITSSALETVAGETDALWDMIWIATSFMILIPLLSSYGTY